MKRKKIIIIKALFTIILLCFTIMPTWSQEVFEGDTNDTTPPASIDSTLLLLFIAAVGLGYVYLNRKLKNKNL